MVSYIFSYIPNIPNMPYMKNVHIVAIPWMTEERLDLDLNYLLRTFVLPNMLSFVERGLALGKLNSD